VLAAAVALRWITWQAYRPALFFQDSWRYLQDALTLQLNNRRPSGYSFAILPLVRTGAISLIPLAQHLLILALAVLLYGFLLRRQVPAWGAALATVPLLWDPLQLVLEQYVLSDVLFEFLLVLACVVLLWRRVPLLIDIAAVGLVLGYAAIVRGAGIGLVVPAVAAALALRIGWRKVATLLIAFAIPLAAYIVAFHYQYGVWGTNTFSSRYLYARVTTFVQCRHLHLPDYERTLCPKQPVEQRPGSNHFLWGATSPLRTMSVPPDMTETQVLNDFDKRVIRAQPASFARYVGRDFLYGFYPSRKHTERSFPTSYLLFKPHYWSLESAPKTARHFQQVGYGPLVTEHGYASFLTWFRNIFHTPGPVLLLAALVGALASAGFRRARWSGNRVACGLLVGACVTPLITTAALSGFDWRYQLPQLGLLAPAGALGLTSMLRRSGPPPPKAAPATLRRLTTWLLRKESTAMPSAAETFVGVAAATVVGAAGAGVAYGSRWAEPATACVLGLIAFATAGVLLFASRWRGTPSMSPAAAANATGSADI
jgi:hypothetical protein